MRVLFLLLFSVNVLAAGGLQLDASAVGEVYNGNIKGQAYASAGYPTVQAGLFAHYGSLTPDIDETMYGIGLLLGKEWQFFLGGGPYNETAFEHRNSGVGGILTLRKRISNVLSFAVPVIYRNVNSGNDIRQELTWYPVIGVRIGS